MMAFLLLAAAAPAAPHQPAPVAVRHKRGVLTTASGLQIETLYPGTGPQPGPESAVLISYEGRLLDGTVFDKSEHPVSMRLRQVIPGFSEGLQLMKQGGSYRVRIPAALGYGERGAGGVIPPNADLVFVISLHGVTRPAQ
jgi:FKBP-type peptidyl-prolyl cis-trans isomerase